MKTPNFLCLGTQKAGTTTLHDILSQHSSIFLPQRKEAHFFDQEERYSKGINWWIDTFFAEYQGEQIWGAITPEYLYYEEVPQRIFNDLGSDVKFVVILRNPVDRAYSHYLMSKRRGFEKSTFQEAIANESLKIKIGEHERNHLSYISRGMYSEQIERYFKLFPRKQFLFLSFEDNICSNLEHSIREIQNFLGVPFEDLDTHVKSNEASQMKSEKVQKLIRSDNFIKRFLKSIIPEKIRQNLKQKAIRLNEGKSLESKKLSKQERQDIFNTYYSGEIKELKKLTGYDFSYWNET